MKKGILFSVTVATLLFSSLSYADSIAKKEAAVVNNPKMTFGNKSAKAKIEEAQNKLIFQSKIDANSFKEEALKDKSKIINYSISKEVAKEKNDFKAAPKEIVTALNKTLEAIMALNSNDTKKAKEALTQADKSFDSALKSDPNLKLVPISVDIEAKVFQSDIKTIKAILKDAQKLLKDSDTQAARALLIPLQDELDIRTKLLPMKLYPIATKEALKALNSGENLKALAILMSSLNTIVEDDVIIPIPLLTAQNLVIAASQLDKSKKDDATKLLVAAQLELEKAVLLGYTKKHTPEYKALKDEIKAIEKEIKGKNEVVKLYDHLKDNFKKLLSSVKSDIVRKEAKHKVYEYQKKEEVEAIKKKEVFEKEATTDLNKTNK